MKTKIGVILINAATLTVDVKLGTRTDLFLLPLGLPVDLRKQTLNSANGLVDYFASHT
jgi:hypothetical protein